MAKVFISYSRKDIDFAKQLTTELSKSELDFWIDWEGIPPTVDWWKEIEKGIEEADAFLFLISPDSAKSKICGQEIDAAVKNGKRIIPIVVREIQWEDTPPKLGHLNYIFFSRDDDFGTATQKLLTAIHTDYEWAATHRRLQVKALGWGRKNRENSLLLRGKDLHEAEFQFTANSSKEPRPTDLQFEYVSESRRVEDKQHHLSRRNKLIISVIGVVLLVTIGLALTGIFNRFIYRPVDMEDYWVTIPAGEFLMGISEEDMQIACPQDCDWSQEQPQRPVFLDEYQIGKYEVTNKQYNQCLRAGVCTGNAVPHKLDHPVVNVNWSAAKTYCEWVHGRLPTEAEWEKAASWDEETKAKFVYPWGINKSTHTLLNFANYNGDTTPVGTYPDGKSPYGVYDMAGNVLEWVNDWYDGTYYQNSPPSNPLGPESGGVRVVRGGSWYSYPHEVSAAYRDWNDPAHPSYLIGFRCARDISP